MESVTVGMPHRCLTPVVLTVELAPCRAMTFAGFGWPADGDAGAGEDGQVEVPFCPPAGVPGLERGLDEQFRFLVGQPGDRAQVLDRLRVSSLDGCQAKVRCLVAVGAHADQAAQ